MAAVASSTLVRPMTVDDIPAVAAIERVSFPTMWPQTAYKRELQGNSMARYLVVAETAPGGATASGHDQGFAGAIRRMLHRTDDASSHETITGFVGLWFLLEECHVVTVAVRPERRRHGIGELLVITSIELALRSRQEVLTLECRASNTGAQALYERYGFANVGLRKRYYSDNNEDALIMTTPPIQTAAYQERFAALRAAHSARWGPAQITLPEA